MLSWLGAAKKGAEAIAEEVDRGPTFGELALRWWEGIESGSIGKRKGGGGSGYSETTLKGYERTLRKRLLPEFGGRHAAEITEVDWQLWVDRLSQEGLSRSRIANQRSVVSAIYGWASRPTRRLVPGNPVKAIELPPNDEKPRTRVAPLEEAEQLLAALEPDYRIPYALAFYAGLRREEIYRLRWEDVELDGYRLVVRKSKSAAGTNPARRSPSRCVRSAARAALQNPSDDADAASVVCVISGKHAAHATTAWRGQAPVNHAARVPPHVRVVPNGGRLHGQGADGVHGPRGPADGQPLREAPAAARGARPCRAPQRLPGRSTAPATCGSGRGMSAKLDTRLDTNGAQRRFVAVRCGRSTRC